MNLANRRPGGIDYGKHLDPNFWDHNGGINWTMKPGVKPSDAIKAVFRLGAGSKMECLSVMSAIYYRALLKAIGEDKFNAVFKDLGMEISQDSSIFDIVPKKPAGQPLKPGDWVYIKGHKDYDSPEMDAALGKGWGPWRGENSVYMGPNQYSGLGLPPESLDEMKSDLLGGYNQKVDAYNKTPYGQLHPKPHGRIEDIIGYLPSSARVPPQA